MTDSKKNILILPKWYPNKDILYHGIFIHRHAVSVTNRYNVYVLFAKSSHQKELIKKENSIIDNIDISIYYYKKNITGLSRLDLLIKLILYLLCVLRGFNYIIKRKIRIDILHVNVLGRTSVVALLINKFYKIPIVITEHWSGYFKERNQYNGFLKKYFDKKVCDVSKVIITVSDSLKTAMKTNGLEGNYKTVRNVVVDDFFNSDFIKPIKTQFLVVADQDNGVKNIQGIINSFSKFNTKEEYNLIIIGGGKDLDLNRSYVNQLGLNETVLLKGEQDPDIIIKELEKSIALILFSNFENSPCVIGESYAVGVPVIATNVGGVKELISSETGILIEAENETQLVDALTKITNSNFDSAIIRNYANDNFSKEKISLQLREIYDSI